MSFRLYWIAVKHPLELPERHLLEIMAAMACDECGYAWPGMPRLIEHTQAQERTVQRLLKKLITSGAVVIYGNPSGGRGHPTEYIVLPGSALIPAPCERCRKRKRPGRAPEPENGTPRPPGSPPQNGDRQGQFTWWNGDWRTPAMLEHLRAGELDLGPKRVT